MSTVSAIAASGESLQITTGQRAPQRLRKSEAGLAQSIEMNARFDSHSVQ